MRWIQIVVAICILVLLLAGCATPTALPESTAGQTPLPATATPTSAPEPTATDAVVVTATAVLPAAGGPVEYPVTEIPLSGPLSNPDAEVSGLAWYGEHLILVPQYPDFAIQEGDGAVFALHKADLLAFLDGGSPGPLQPIPVPFVAPGLAAGISGFEGYEAIAFLGDQAFLTIEAFRPDGMRAYLVSGQMAPDLSALILNTATVTEIAAQAKVENKSDEALLVAGDRLVTIYEVNGTGINASPVAHLFDMQLAPAGTISFPNVEYRITDATTLDGEGRFWAMNYFFPGDTEQRPDSDPLAERYGQGPTHAKLETVERLLEFQLSESGIGLADTPPIQLELPDTVFGGLGRNWEGLVRLDDRGFLLVTDLFPGTILAFVPAPQGE